MPISLISVETVGAFGDEPSLVRHLTECVAGGRIDAVGPALRMHYRTRYAIETGAEAGRLYFTPRLSRPSADTLRIDFAEDMAACPILADQMQWLVWLMPLLDTVMTRDEWVLGGATLNQWSAGFLPGLSYCANASDFVLIPDIDFLRSCGYRSDRHDIAAASVPWEARAPVALWRGAMTEQASLYPDGWRTMPRARLCLLARGHPELIDAGITDATDQEVAAEGLVRQPVSSGEFQNWRYHVDIDGSTNEWAPLFLKLLSGSTVLKVESAQHFRQWYYRRLVPWVHYVPVRADLDDLPEKAQWLRTHDALAQRIGAAGRALAESMTFETEMRDAAASVDLAFQIYG